MRPQAKRKRKLLSARVPIYQLGSQPITPSRAAGLNGNRQRALKYRQTPYPWGTVCPALALPRDSLTGAVELTTRRRRRYVP
jgi:hypothetical protein